MAAQPPWLSKSELLRLVRRGGSGKCPEPVTRFGCFRPAPSQANIVLATCSLKLANAGPYSLALIASKDWATAPVGCDGSRRPTELKSLAKVGRPFLGTSSRQSLGHNHFRLSTGQFRTTGAENAGLATDNLARDDRQSHPHEPLTSGIMAPGPRGPNRGLGLMIVF